MHDYISMTMIKGLKLDSVKMNNSWDINCYVMYMDTTMRYFSSIFSRYLEFLNVI